MENLVLIAPKPYGFYNVVLYVTLVVSQDTKYTPLYIYNVFYSD